MKLRELHVRRMPGFEERGFRFSADQLGDALNLIVGPNGSGKTTACRAIRGLLWPATLKNASPVSLVGTWDDGGCEIRLELESAQIRCQRDGIAAEPPALPGPHLAHCFTVTIDDLFLDDATDEALAEEIVRQMAGGYDLNAIRRLEELKPWRNRNHGRKENDDFRAAKERVAAIRAEQKGLLDEEAALGDLERQAAEALAAQGRLARLDDVRGLLDVRGEVRAMEGELALLPQGMSMLRGDEADRLEQIRGDLDKSTRGAESAARAAQRAEAEMGEAGLPEGGIAQVRLDEQDARLGALRGVETDLRDAQRRLAEADQRLADAQGALGEVGEAEKLPDLDAAGLDEIETFHRDAEEIAFRMAHLRGRIGTAEEEEPPPGDADTLRQAIAILREWFEVAPAAAAGGGGNRVLVWVLSAVLAVTGAVVGLSVSPWGWLLLVPAFVGAVVAAMIGRGGAGDPRAERQSRYARLPVDPPTSWDKQTVGRHLNALEQRWDRARLADATREDRRELAQWQRKGEALAQRRAELVKKLGVLPGTSNLRLNVFAANLRSYQEARTSREVCGGEAERLRDAHARQLALVNAFLVEFGQAPCESFEIASVRSKEIAKRADCHRNATKDLAKVRGDAESHQAQAREHRRRKAELFTAAGLDEDDDAQLRARLDRRSDYQETIRKLNDGKARESTFLQKLDGAADLSALGEDRAALEAEGNRLAELAGNYRGLVEKIKDIRLRVDDVRSRTSLEDALAELDRAEDRLAQRRDEALFAAAGNFLLDGVEAEHKAATRPQAFEKAAQWFNRFTRGRYELLIDDTQPSQPALAARETTTGRGLALGELSRGTRMQLLLASRLGFAAGVQRDTQLPLILDEVLSSSDPRRYRAIIECLLAVARDGRQVFYFTCRPGDARAWRELAAAEGGVEVKLIQLGEPDAAGPAVPTDLIEPIPAPGERTLDQYAHDLGVGGLAASAGAAPAHVAHFVDDAAQLHRLLSAGVTTCGQLLSLASHGPVDAYIGDADLARVRAKACVLDAFADAWRIGRGPRLTREVLEDAGVPRRYIDGITEMAHDFGGDAKRLVAALRARTDDRAKGIHTTTLDSVVEALVATGHLDDREPLTRDAAFAAVLVAANDHVKRGEIDTAAVGTLFERLWRQCTDAEAR